MTGTGGTVLITADDAGFRELYRAWFPAVYDIRMTVDGRDALDRLTRDVDAVVLDREMPRMRGEAVAAAVDDREIDSAVLMVSSIENDAEFDDSLIDQYLRKPVGREAFLAAMDDALATTRDSRSASADRRSNRDGVAVARPRQ